MPRSIVRQLSSMMAFEIEVEPLLSKNRFGEETYGPVFKVRGRLKNGNKIVKDRTGQEVVSKVQFWAAGVFGLTTEHRYTLPAPWSPTQPAAIVVNLLSDEHAVHHEVVMF